MTTFKVRGETETKQFLNVRMEDHDAGELLEQLNYLFELHGEHTTESEDRIEHVLTFIAELSVGLERL